MLIFSSTDMQRRQTASFWTIISYNFVTQKRKGRRRFCIFVLSLFSFQLISNSRTSIKGVRTRQVEHWATSTSGEAKEDQKHGRRCANSSIHLDPLKRDKNTLKRGKTPPKP